MTKEQLKSRVAKVLGVSASEKELAFDVLKSSLSESLEYNQAIRIEDIGIFQLKKEPLPREERKEGSKEKAAVKDTLLYTPLPNDISKDSENLFLSFDVSVPKKQNTEFDESVFSIGVGKPTIPIGNRGGESGESTSYAALRKSLEQKTAKEIEASERMDDFDIWDDYLSNVTAYLQEGNESEPLLTREEEPELETEEPESAQPEQQEEYDPEDIEKLFQQEEEPNGEPEPDEEPDEGEPEEIIEEQEEEPVEDFEDLTVPEVPEEEISDTESEETPEEFDHKEETVDETGGEEELAGFDEDEELDAFSKFHEEMEDEEPQEGEPEDIPAEDEEPELPEGFEEMVADEEEAKEEDVDWNWGGELEDELEQGSEEGEDAESGGFDELEKKLTGEIEAEVPETEAGEEAQEQTEDNPDEEEPIDETDAADLESEFSAPRQEIEDDDMEDDSGEEDKKKPKLGFKSLKARRESLGKMFWIILAGFVVVTVGGIYLLFGGGGSEEAEHADGNGGQVTEQHAGEGSHANGLEAEDGTAEENNSGQPSETQHTGTEQSDNPPVESEQTGVNDDNTTPKDGALYRPVPNDQRITSQIYSDGSRYMVQVSSWKRNGTAETEARRLRAKGYDAFIVEAYLPNLGGTWYRVRVGYFGTRTDAQKFLNNGNY